MMPEDKPKPDQPQKPGPDAERLKIDLDWEDAAKKITQKKRPKDGWPDPNTCDHSELGREVMFGQKTGDYRCRICGEVFTPEQAKAIRDGRENQQ